MLNTIKQSPIAGWIHGCQELKLLKLKIELVRNLKMSCDAAWGENEALVGPFGVDYYYVYCRSGSWSWVVILWISIWVVMLMSLLAQTASDYFSPTLGKICSKLKLPYDIAGVTFLALGNGAPDFFSLIASFSGGVDVMVGVGALLGGSMFVCTVVVGSIAILCPCDVSPKLFLRDISFHLISVCLVGIVAVIRDVTLPLAFVLVVFYIAYVAFVIGASFCSNKGLIDMSSHNDQGDIAMANLTNIQTAFWHNFETNNSKPGIKPKKEKQAGASSSPYSFLILENETEFSKDLEGDEDGPEDSVVTLNFSGGFEPSFDDIIQDDYYEVSPPPNENNDLQVTNTPLHQSLLGEEQLASRDNYSALRKYGSRFLQNNLQYQSLISSMYWQQWALRKKFKHNQLDNEWESYSWYYKLYFWTEYPWVLARDLTIPTLDDTAWNKFHAVLHPFADSLMFCFVFDIFQDSMSMLSIIATCLAVGAMPSFIIYLSTSNSKAPADPYFFTLWALLAFVMCICWVYMLAGELVTCLSVLGLVMELPPAFLGLTVLAWGNSIGDFFTNISVAKQGLGSMAIAGCYAGPVFNILIGFGLSLVYASSTTYPSPYSLVLDQSSLTSVIFLLVALTSTMIIVTTRSYKLDRQLGYFLIGLYITYSCCQGLLVALS